MSFIRKPVFTPQEMNVVGEKVSAFGTKYELFNTPVSYRENFIAHYSSKEPWFCAINNESVAIKSTGYAENLSRPHGKDMVDCFGVPWKWVPEVGGAITPGGNPVFDDANEWKDKIKMPDINSWNWEEDAKIIPDSRFACNFTLLNGFWFERLISLMDFENAAVALVDPDQKDAVKELFEATTNLAIDLVDKYFEYFPCLDYINIHDDWGSQKNPFFSEEVAREMFLPYMKELVNHVHSKGRFMTLHSCGHIEDRVNIFIEAGFDGWAPQTMNNIRKLYEEFGDKIVFDAWAEPFDINDDMAAKQAARDFVDFYCHPGKTALLGSNHGELKSRVFKEELYEYSRKAYLK